MSKKRQRLMEFWAFQQLNERASEHLWISCVLIIGIMHQTKKISIVIKIYFIFLKNNLKEETFLEHSCHCDGVVFNLIDINYKNQMDQINSFNYLRKKLLHRYHATLRNRHINPSLGHLVVDLFDYARILHWWLVLVACILHFAGKSIRMCLHV